MNYTEEYNTKDAMITLLQDFLSNITEEYEASEDIVQVLSSPANDEYIEKIKSGLELCCPAEIEEKFTQTIESALSGDLTEFSEFDSIITELYGDIDRLSYKSGSNIQEGVYQSPLEDLTIGTIWTSNGTSSIGNPSISVHMRPHKKHTDDDEENTIEIDYISYYLEKATENNTIAWYDGDISAVSKDFAFDLYNINPITDRKIESSNIKNTTVYYAPFEFEVYKNFIKEEKYADVKPIDLGTIVTFFFVSLTTEQDEILSSYGIVAFSNDDTIGQQACQCIFLGKLEDTTEAIYNSIITNQVYFDTLGEANERDLDSVLQHKTKVFSNLNFCKIYKHALEKCAESEFQKEMLEIMNNGFNKLSDAYAYWGLKELMLTLPTLLKGFGIDTSELEETLNTTESEISPMSVDSKIDKILEMTLEELDLSVRSFNCLKRAGFNTVKDITQCTEYEIRRIRNLGRKASDEIVDKIYLLGLSFRSECESCDTALTDEDIQAGHKLCSDCRNSATKSEKQNDFTIEDIKLPIRTINCFMRAGVYDIDILTTKTFEELKRIRNLGMRCAIDFLYKFDEVGYRIKDCSIEDYPTIDDFVKDNFNCLECSSSLNGTSDNLKRRLCTDCASRLDRLANATTITLEVKKPEFQTYTGDEHGFTVYININSQIDKPIKLKLEECSIYTDGRQRISNYHYTGYAFSEEYVFPNTAKTFAKIWITDKWDIKELSDGEDYITISFKDTNSNKTYFFKFLFVNDFSDWRFYDYYELD